MHYETAIWLGTVIAVVLTVLLYIKVLPRVMDGNLGNKFLQFLHDYFHFKKLYLEDVLKALFTLATVACVVIGFLLLLGYEESYHSYYFTSGGYWSKESTFAYGLSLLVGGPISLRLVYEGMMMFILLVRNTIEINSKLSAPQQEKAPAEEK